MKKNTKFFIYLLFIISVGACGKAPTPQAAPAALYTQISLTAAAEFLATAPVLPATASPITPVTPTVTATTFTTPKPTFTPIMPPTVPGIAPTIDPAQIKSALTLETLDKFNGHNLRRISGWHNGFNGFEWMADSKHLLLFPITGKGVVANDGTGQMVFPSHITIINLDSAKIWLPGDQYHLISPEDFSRFSNFNPFPTKSLPQPRVLLNGGTDTSTLLYSLEGDLLKTYQGTLVGVSPSGSKIILAGSPSDPINGTETKWIDLLNDKEVVFDSHTYPSSYGSPIIWSPDEMSVYVNAFGHHYGNAKTGEIFNTSDIISDEEINHLMETYLHSLGVWVLNDTYLLTRWNQHDEGAPGFVSIFDPAKKGYRNLSALAGLPNTLEVTAYAEAGLYPCDNGQPMAAPGGRYVWVNCQDGGRLIDMQTFKAQTFPDYPQATLQWSADGSFAWISKGGSIDQKILSAANKKITTMPTDAECTTWHPSQNIFAYLSNNGQTLSIFNAGNLSVQKQVDLPVAMRCFNWNATGDKMALMAKDNSVWQIDTSTLGNLNQLMPPLERSGEAAWSPDGRLVAIPVDTDIYIVDTGSKP